MSIIDEDTTVLIDSVPSEELTALAFTTLNRCLEEPALAKQLEPYEFYILIVNNEKRETGRASQTFNPPEDSGFDIETWALVRLMALQCRDVIAVSKMSPLMRTMALGMVADMLEVLTRGLPR